MLEDFKKEFNLVRILLILLTIAVGMYVLGLIWQIVTLFSDILIILIISWLLSFILEPVVEKINHLTRLSKTISAILTYLFFAAVIGTVIFFFIPIVTEQIQTLSITIPTQLQTAPQFLNNWGNVITSSLNNSISIIPSIAQFLFSTLIILILSFYIIIEQQKIDDEIFSLVPKKWHEKVRFMQSVINKTFGSFLRVQLIFGIISGVLTWLVLRILGIDFAASVSLLSGIFAIIPLVGPVLAIIPPVFVALIFNPQKAIFIFAILLIAQQFIFNVLGPKLFSKALKLNPIIILISFLVGAKVAGAIGAIFAIPVLGVLAVVIKDIWKNTFAKNSD